MKQKKPGISFGITVTVLVALMSALFLSIGAYRVYHSYASLHWPHVEGKVISSGMAEHDSDHGRHCYTPEITYSYSVGSDSYVGSQIRWVPMVSSADHIGEIVKPYPRGKAVAVYYKPSNPNVSVLEPGAFPRTWPHAAFGLILLAIVILIVATASKRKQRAKEPRTSPKQEGDKAVTPATLPPLPPGPPGKEKGFMSGIVWILLVSAGVWWFGAGASGSTGEELTGFRKLMAILTSGPVSIFLDVLWKVLVVLFGIFVVFLFRQVERVPTMTRMGDSKESSRAPAPRDSMEAQLQSLGFHYLGDFDFTSIASISARIRAYGDPDYQCATALADIESSLGKQTVVEYETMLIPTGSITTTTNPFLPIHSYPPERMVVRVPWKQTATEVYALHQRLCRIARDERFEARTVHTSMFAESIRRDVRRHYDYQVQTGRLKVVGEDQYHMTVLGAIIAVPILWGQMTYGFLFSWYRTPDWFFAWKVRRRLKWLRKTSRSFITVFDESGAKARFCISGVIVKDALLEQALLPGDDRCLPLTMADGVVMALDVDTIREARNTDGEYSVKLLNRETLTGQFHCEIKSEDDELYDLESADRLVVEPSRRLYTTERGRKRGWQLDIVAPIKITQRVLRPVFVTEYAASGEDGRTEDKWMRSGQFAFQRENTTVSANLADFKTITFTPQGSNRTLVRLLSLNEKETEGPLVLTCQSAKGAHPVRRFVLAAELDGEKGYVILRNPHCVLTRLKE